MCPCDISVYIFSNGGTASYSGSTWFLIISNTQGIKLHIFLFHAVKEASVAFPINTQNLTFGRFQFPRYNPILSHTACVSIQGRAW